ncbi:Hef nuclease [Klebsiella variicola]|uniref:DEAD/DEAH box helicase n=2 Tax=Enterobacterales TaxID=91347 RepID=UPI0007CC3113|nr:DEAD/DEAH box helicase family protein [Klebsiella variicola]SBK35249.1 Hef nuclease [Klebsiella variicola]
MPNFFRDSNGALNLAAQTLVPNQGFRAGQLGALHAAMAHYSVYADPAIICLPTGYGKTSVMMALPFLVQSKRVLVVEPSNALRKQVSSHFAELSTLKRIGAIPVDLANPSVLRHEGRPQSEEDWQVLESHDVVVSTPSSSSPAVAPGASPDLFDLIVFDEAHHAPASTWAAYLEHYTKARFVFLTATPFRRDGQVIPGKLVYRYPVMKAVDEGAFHPVAFRAAPIQNTVDDHHIDLVIAETAVNQLHLDLAAGHDHRLFVRAATINAARALVPIYQALGVNVEAVDSKITKRTQDRCEQRLVSGELQGIVCVDMFGEGYDFPKLKVAALHTPHRSLVPTIQFIGRFARVDKATGQATLIAPLPRVLEAPSALLKEGVDLASMIDAAAQAEMAGDAAELEMVERLKLRRMAESNYDAVSPLAIELYAHVCVFRCSTPPIFAQIKETLGRDLRVVKQWASDDGALTLILTSDENPPNFATSDVLVNIRHDAFLLLYFADSQLCYIGSTRRTEKIYLGLMDMICPQSYRSLSYEETSRARAGLEGVRFFNVGLKNTTFNSQSETYRTLTGPAAERAVTAGDSRAYSQGHFFGSGSSGGEKETIGASSSSRIWSNQRLSIAEFNQWVARLDGRLAGNAPFSETRLDVIRSATTLQKLPDLVIAGTWPRAGFKANPRIRIRRSEDQRPLYSRLTEWDLADFDCRPLEGQLLFSIHSEEACANMLFSPQGRMVILLDQNVVLEIESASEQWMPLADWLSEPPPMFYASDKSTFEGLNLMLAPQLQAVSLTKDDTKVIDWDECEIKVEFVIDNDTEKAREQRAELQGKRTVQEHLEHYLLGLPNVFVLFYDHRSGEAADYIAVTVGANGVVDITLYHCKGAGGAPSGGRVDDVYEVAGQLVKSVFYCDVSVLLAHMEDRMSQRFKSPSRFVVGDLQTLKERLYATRATQLGFTVVGVQPGISNAAIDAHLADLMSFGISYAMQGGATRAYWLVSE